MCLLPSNVKLPTDPRAGGGNKDARQFFKQMTILYKVKTNSKNISFYELCCLSEPLPKNALFDGKSKK